MGVFCVYLKDSEEEKTGEKMEKNSRIRHARTEELDEIMNIYASARNFMAENGNAEQWGEDYPQRELVEEDLKKKQLYVYEDAGEIGAAFVFFIGTESDYETSVAGAWTSPVPYGVLHRIAVAIYGKGIASKCLQWCYEQCHCMRGDTGQKNKSMQRLFEKNGFTQCARIHPWYGEMLGYEKYEKETNVC